MHALGWPPSIKYEVQHSARPLVPYPPPNKVKGHFRWLARRNESLVHPFEDRVESRPFIAARDQVFTV